MDKITALMDKLAPSEGLNATNLQGTAIYKITQYRGREPIIYCQGIILVGQGAKRVYVGGTTYDYDPDNYLVLSVPIPAECETYASIEKPLLAIQVDIDIGMLNRIINHLDAHIDYARMESTEKHQGIYTAHVTPEIKDVVKRLLTALQSPLESSILGNGLIYELLFRIMCGENAASLYALAMKNTSLAKIDKALKHIHSNFDTVISVGGLATLVNMSPSAFHRAFNNATASSPIQYIKNIRLSKAREMLVDNGLRVSEAANHVGYESTAQFSREFKRYFGISPSGCRRLIVDK